MYVLEFDLCKISIGYFLIKAHAKVMFVGSWAKPLWKIFLLNVHGLILWKTQVWFFSGTLKRKFLGRWVGQMIRLNVYKSLVFSLCPSSLCYFWCVCLFIFIFFQYFYCLISTFIETKIIILKNKVLLIVLDF